MADKLFLAGAAQVDVTPPLGTFINGDFVAHYARYIHDPLYAKAVVFQQGGLLVATVVVDICVMPKDFLDDVKNDIEQATGIPPNNILISSTHTHAGGSVAAVYLGAADLQYRSKLPALIVQAVVQAKQKMHPAQIAWGAADVPEHVLSRRYIMKPGYVPVNPINGEADMVKTNPFGAEHMIAEMSGAIDPQVGFVAIKSVDGKWIALLANYSLHYVGDWDNGTISADYFGVFAARIKEKLGAGDEFIGIMSNGTSGNINIWDFRDPYRYPRENFQKSELIGEDIAEKVHQQLQQSEWEQQPDLRVAYSELSLQLRKPDADELKAAEEVVRKTHYEGLQTGHIDDIGLSKLYAREQVLLNDLPDSLQFPAQAIKLGSGVIGALGAEMFAETGLWVKQRSAVKNYFTVCLANGNAGYVPPEHEFSNGGYETWRGRTSMLITNAEATIKNELIQLINEVI